MDWFLIRGGARGEIRSGGQRPVSPVLLPLWARVSLGPSSTRVGGRPPGEFPPGASSTSPAWLERWPMLVEASWEGGTLCSCASGLLECPASSPNDVPWDVTWLLGEGACCGLRPLQRTLLIREKMCAVSGASSGNWAIIAHKFGSHSYFFYARAAFIRSICSF